MAKAENEDDLSPLAVLYARDPNKCTDEDVDAIVLSLRERRRLFSAAEVEAANKPKAASKIAAPKAKKPALEAGATLDLGFLGLGGPTDA